MLRNLHVKNLALIEEVEIEFGEGLNILTGETGAGKSIILGSVNLALGGRFSKDMIREGARFGLVELTFSVNDIRQKERLKGLDIFPEEGEVILSRKLMDGRSVSRINGETVSLQTVKKAAEILIDIHGQHEHQSLLYEKNHLKILDEFAKEKTEILKLEVEKQFLEYQSALRKLADLSMDEQERRKEQDFLAFEIQQIREANLKQGEDGTLEEAYRRMLGGKKICETLDEVYQYTGQMELSASALISRAIRCMQEISSYEPMAQSLYEELVNVDALLNDFNRDLAQYQKSFEFSEQDFCETEERLNEINRLKMKYGNSINEILSYMQEKEKRMEQLCDYETYMEKLKTQIADMESSLKAVSLKLRAKRQDAAVSLSKQIKAGLKELNFLDVKFDIRLKEKLQYSKDGMDEAEFLVSMNPGEPVRPLKDIASGGELSRIMLVIKSVLADKDEVDTLLFDEIDTGISGRTAQKVSEKMGMIAKDRQVICITHLAQIAAMADEHFVIEKNAFGNTTKTQIRRLEDEEITQELARILGGALITDAVLENAREMKELANRSK